MSFGGSNNIRSSPKGASASAPITSTAQGSNNQAVDVQVWHQGAAVNPARALTASDVVTSNQGGTWTVPRRHLD